MENNTVNPAPITQTLFRFVSLRNPQLADEATRELRFVEKKAVGGFFENAVQNKAANVSKLAAMLEATNNFGPLSEAECKQLNVALYKFSVWLTRNKTTATKEEIAEAISIVGTVDQGLSAILWNNLFYQVLTQKEFYAKEVIMQLLLATHLISFHQTTNIGEIDDASLQSLLNATVVLPKSLFVEDATNDNTVVIVPDPKGKATPLSAFMQKQQAVLLAKKSIADLGILSSELKVIEKQYQKDRAVALKQYEDNYNDDVTSIMNEYETAVATKKALWIENNTPEAYKTDNPFLQPEPVPMPDLPSFDFQYLAEVQAVSLQNQLSSVAKNAFLNLPNVNNIGTFTELRTTMNDAINQNNDIIIRNTETGQQVLSVGGVLMNETNSTYRTAFEYELTPKQVSQTLANFDMAFDVPDSSWDVASMHYSLAYENQTSIANTYYDKSRIGNTILLANLFSPGISPVPANELFEMNGEITFTNGTKMSFIIDDISFDQSFTGRLTGEIETGGEGVDVIPAEAFIPKGFGYKQIGIADYKKVEQTVHSYLEGEVAHIENIMAREYKEKATRRLRKSETTTTTSSESEKEQLTDTNSTSRFELQSEIAKVLQESKDFSANASYSAGFTALKATMNISAGANYATHNSKEESTRQAITEAKEITQRALDRLVTKVKEERVEKIIEEYEERNTHGFDNKTGDKHVTGVYRWVDKLMKNRIVNFGKRLMFEFMIPQPAKLHTLGLKDEAVVTSLVKPEDPRTSNSYFQIADFTQLTETNAKYWASKYNAEITPMPQEEIFVGESYDYSSVPDKNAASKSSNITIPDGYYTTKVSANFSGRRAWAQITHSVIASVGNCTFYAQPFPVDIRAYQPLDKFVSKIPVSFSTTTYHSVNVTINVGCQLTDERKKQWQQETFAQILKAYQNQLSNYDKAIESEKQKVAQIKTDNPLFYRQIENTILRKNCIAYLVDKNANASKTYGKSMSNNSSSFSGYEVNNIAQLDSYTAFAKFLEQAFEWDVMSYNLYPFYWAGKQDWLKLYQNDNADPLFRSFLQSGMARVVVTVRPGFEAAVQHYMSTGQIWSGGQVPVIGDPLYLSLVDELKEATGKPEGKAWMTRVPTTLNILQADSIGLKVDKALPNITGDISDFEDPSQVPVTSNFELTDAKMENERTNTQGVGTVQGDQPELVGGAGNASSGLMLG